MILWPSSPHNLPATLFKNHDRKTPYNLWGPENRCFVDPVFKERVRDGNVPARQQAALRSALYKELFNELPADEQREWAKRAEREHSEALSKFDNTLKKVPSDKPEDRQRYAPICRDFVRIYLTLPFSSLCRILECFSRFVQPIVDLLADHSGWKGLRDCRGPTAGRRWNACIC